MDVCMKKMGLIHTMGYYVALKEKEFLPYGMT
jgi:hypothetical protein